MTTDRWLPAPVHPFGPFNDLALQVHELTTKGRSTEALRLADKVERIAAALGDDRTVGMITQGRIYALVVLGRLQEALVTAEPLLRLHRATGAVTSEAKILADMSEVLIKLGRLDDGLASLARAIRLLEHSPRSNIRYYSAMSSVVEAARAAELYELADQSARLAAESFEPGSGQQAAADLQQAELMLEWGMRLEHIGRADEARLKYERGLALMSVWTEVYASRGPGAHAPLATALYALALAKLGFSAEAAEIASGVVVPLRAAGEYHEARLAHLAYGVALRSLGDLPSARREFIAAEELSVGASRLLFQYELVMLAVAEDPSLATRTMLDALHAQAKHLWRLRLERKAMLHQARLRVDLEAEHARADRAAAQDALTGLGNRRSFDRQIAAVDRRAGGSVTLMLVDVDRFKNINDHYSHGVGDVVLREIAGVLRAHCREDDVAVRFGGDEFAVFLRTDLMSAAAVGERVRAVVADRDWAELGPGLKVTLSIGVAELANGMSGRDLYEVADRHLYAAKRGGRDKVAA